jgi:Ca-activated chloride channel homolog
LDIVRPLLDREAGVQRRAIAVIEMRLQRPIRPIKLLANLGLAVTLSVILVADLAWACRQNAMIVFDASASMGETANGFAKIELARKAVAAVLPDVTRFRPTGLVTFGGSKGISCGAVAVQVEPQMNSDLLIAWTLKGIQPFGATPLTDGVRAAVEVVQRFAAPGLVVLITDGGENCGGSVCGLAHQLQDRGDRIRVHVIGLFLDDGAAGTMHCLTDATGGTYVSSNSLESLRDALRALLGCPQTSGLSRALP